MDDLEILIMLEKIEDLRRQLMMRYHNKLLKEIEQALLEYKKNVTQTLNEQQQKD